MKPSAPTMQATGTVMQTGRNATRPQVGTAPVNWNNDDLRDWAPHVPFPALLDEMAAVGYAGTEYGAGFPTDSVLLHQALNERGLQLCGAYQWLHLLDDERFGLQQPVLDARLKLLAAVGCRHLIVASAMSEERIALAGRVPPDGSAGLTPDQWAAVGSNLALAAERAAEWGIQTHYHNHVGTHIETPAEVEALLDYLPAAGVDLCFDTGHYAYGGGDPTAFATRHADRIGYLHLKDVDAETLARARRQGWSFLDTLRHCIFCEFGDGMVDIPRVIGALTDAGYQGWIIVEQDTSRRLPTESAAASRAYLRDCCGL